MKEPDRVAMASSTPNLAESIRSLGMRHVSLPKIRSFVDESDAFLSALQTAEPWLPSAIETLSTQLPLMRTVGPFVARPFFRPPGSYRSFYYGPATLHHPLGTENGRAVIAFKGLEPCAEDIDLLFEDLQRACYSPHNIAEHLALVERKIPGCVSLAEAIREAERAAAVHSRHFRFYGTVAHLPLPLFVYRHSDDVREAAAQKLRSCLGAAAFEAIGPALGSGLGVYVYYYPTAPVRVREIDELFQGIDFRERLIVLMRALGDPEKVIESWAREFARMLYLGFLPASLASLHTGNCCQPQNACLDGGFVDLDSLTSLDELRSDTEIQAALQLSVESLIQSVRTLVAGSTDPIRSEGTEIRMDLHYFNQYVLALLGRTIETEARPGLELDTRIRGYFSSPRNFEELVGRLSSYYSPPSRFDAVNSEFSELGQELLRSIGQA
jgi:hypothetical protein